MRSFFASLFLSFLRIVSQIQLRKINPKIIGIGGSSGKSSVSYLTSIILSKKYKVKSSSGKNSESGIPLSILNLEPGSYNTASWLFVGFMAIVRIFTDFKKYDVYVVEMGIDGPLPPKNMEYLLKIVKPHISALTNINLEHSVYFQDIVGESDPDERKKKILSMIQVDEARLITDVDQSSSAVVNSDDPLILGMLGKVRATLHKVSATDKKAEFFIRKWGIDNKKTVVEFDADGKSYKISINRPLPYFYSYSVVFSVALSKLAGIAIEESIKSLEEDFDLPPGRLSIFEGVKGTTILDSSYNSSLEALSGILEMSKSLSVKRRVGIIGDIREQGEQSGELHREAARSIIKNLDYAILIGPLMKKFASPVLEEARFNFKSFDTLSQAREHILKDIEEGDLIIVKGSQNTLLLERAVEMLLKNRRDLDMLCRRGEYWDEQRKATL